MSKSTYYIVQITSDMFIMRTDDGRYVPTYDRDRVAKLSLADAREIYKTHCRYAQPNTPHRFPRIIKVTTEYKTITNRR